VEQKGYLKAISAKPTPGLQETLDSTTVYAC